MKVRQIAVGFFALMVAFAFATQIMAAQHEKGAPKPAAKEAPKPAAKEAAKPAAKAPSASGEVTNVNAMEKMVTIKTAGKDGKEMAFSVGADTKISKGKDKKELADLMVGDKVRVQYKKGEGDKMAAASISITPPAAAKPAAKQADKAEKEKPAAKTK